MSMFPSRSRQMRLDLSELRLWLVWFQQATDDGGRQRCLDQIIAASDRISALLGERFPSSVPDNPYGPASP